MKKREANPFEAIYRESSALRSRLRLIGWDREDTLFAETLAAIEAAEEGLLRLAAGEDLADGLPLFATRRSPANAPADGPTPGPIPEPGEMYEVFDGVGEPAEGITFFATDPISAAARAAKEWPGRMVGPVRVNREDEPTPAPIPEPGEDRPPAATDLVFYQFHPAPRPGTEVFQCNRCNGVRLRSMPICACGCPEYRLMVIGPDGTPTADTDAVGEKKPKREKKPRKRKADPVPPDSPAMEAPPTHRYDVYLAPTEDEPERAWFCIMEAPSLAAARAEAPARFGDEVRPGTQFEVEPSNAWIGGRYAEIRECVACGERWPAYDGEGCPKCVHGPIPAIAAKAEPVCRPETAPDEPQTDSSPTDEAQNGVQDEAQDGAQDEAHEPDAFEPYVFDVIEFAGGTGPGVARFQAAGWPEAEQRLRRDWPGKYLRQVADWRATLVCDMGLPIEAVDAAEIQGASTAGQLDDVFRRGVSKDAFRGHGQELWAALQRVSGRAPAPTAATEPAPKIDGVVLRPDDPRYYQFGGKPPSADHAGTGDVAKWLAEFRPMLVGDLEARDAKLRELTTRLSEDRSRIVATYREYAQLGDAALSPGRRKEQAARKPGVPSVLHDELAMFYGWIVESNAKLAALRALADELAEDQLAAELQAERRGRGRPPGGKKPRRPPMKTFRALYRHDPDADPIVLEDLRAASFDEARAMLPEIYKDNWETVRLPYGTCERIDHDKIELVQVPATPRKRKEAAGVAR